MAMRMAATTTIITMRPAMGETAGLLRLMAWLSPVFPTGGFAYSAGLEAAVASRRVGDTDTLAGWIESLLRHGAIRNELILVAESWRHASDDERLVVLSSLCEALAESAERWRETMDQGRSFLDAAKRWPRLSRLPQALALPVAVGAAAGRSDTNLADTLAAYANAFATNQAQVGIRLSITGQDGAARILAGLEPVLEECVENAMSSGIDSLGSATFLANIACMNHETLQPRLFLS